MLDTFIALSYSAYLTDPRLMVVMPGPSPERPNALGQVAPDDYAAFLDALNDALTGDIPLYGVPAPLFFDRAYRHYCNDYERGRDERGAAFAFGIRQAYSELTGVQDDSDIGPLVQPPPPAVVIVPPGTLPVSDGTGLLATYGSAGLATLKYNGYDLLNGGTGTPLATTVLFENGDGTASPGSKTALTTVATGQTVTVGYDWGSILCAYAKTGNNLTLTITVSNTSAKAMRSFAVRPMMLHFPQSPGLDQGVGVASMDRPAAVIAPFGLGKVALTYDANEPPAAVSFTRRTSTAADPFTYYVGFANKEERATDYIHSDEPSIAVGASRTYSMTMRFAEPSVSDATLLSDTYTAFRTVHPFAITWTDKRPIGSIFLANSPPRGSGFAGNPRGWFNNSTLDVSTTAGQAYFRTRMLQYADTCVANLLNIGGQGMIFWDLEGEQFTHPTTYLGDPRMLSAFAPEMDAIADEWFARFTAAGLRTGLTIRPSQLYQTSAGVWTHGHLGFDPVAKLSDKIAYAQARWGSGCSLFYIDSNTTYAYPPEHQAGDAPDSWKMRAYLMEALRALHPDVLLIPEIENVAYYGSTAPYNELKTSADRTPADVLSVYLSAFSVINTADGNFETHHANLVAAVRAGNILMTRCWFSEPGLLKVKGIYQEAAV